jgi:hypothetical protein
MAMRLGGVIKSKGLAGVVEGGGARQIMPATPVSEEIESRRHLRFFAENDPRDTVMLLSSKGKTAQQALMCTYRGRMGTPSINTTKQRELDVNNMATAMHSLIKLRTINQKIITSSPFQHPSVVLIII